MKKIKEYIRLFLSYSRSHKQQKKETKFRIRNLSFLLPHIKKYSSRYIVLCFLLVISSVLSLPSPAITGYIIDNVFVTKDISKLNLLVGILITILILSEIFHAILEYLRLRLSQEFAFSIRISLIERILKFPMSFFREYKTGYLVARIDEVNILGNFLSVTLVSLAGNIIRFFGAVFLISRYNTKLTFIAILVLPLFFEVSRRSLGAIRSTSIEAMESGAEIRGKIQETLSGIEVVKTYTKEDLETNKIKSGLRKMVELEIAQNLFSSLSGKMLSLTIGLNLLVILWVGGHEIIANRLTIGQYVAFVAYIGFLYGPIQMFAMTFLQFQRIFMASKRISSFLDKTSEAENPKRNRVINILKGNLQFQNVYFNYEKGNKILRNINLSICNGEKIAFIGKSGAGKSTLMHLILGIYEPTAGTIKFDGIDATTINLESLRNRIGIVSQNIFLFDDTVLNNIKYSTPDASIEEVLEAAKSSGCHDFISRFPKKYETEIGEIGKRLSGGEKQRISIARCLLKNPDLVILDEPTTHLDPESINKQTAALRTLLKNKTCIIISHHWENFDWIDRIYVLDKGKIIQNGTHNELMMKPGKYRQLHDNKSTYMP